MMLFPAGIPPEMGSRNLISKQHILPLQFTQAEDVWLKSVLEGKNGVSYSRMEFLL